MSCLVLSSWLGLKRQREDAKPHRLQRTVAYPTPVFTNRSGVLFFWVMRRNAGNLTNATCMKAMLIRYSLVKAAGSRRQVGWSTDV
jgi:hypothetical protein